MHESQTNNSRCSANRFVTSWRRPTQLNTRSHTKDQGFLLSIPPLPTTTPSGNAINRLCKGAAWSVVGAITANGFSLLASFAVARALDREGFGSLGIITSTIGMAGSFAGLGLGLTATKYVSQLRLKHKPRAGRVIGLALVLSAASGLLMSLATYVGAKFLAEHLLNSRDLVVSLQAAALMLLFNALLAAETGVLAGLEAFKAIAWTGTARGVLSACSIWVGASVWGLSGAVWANVLTSIVAATITSVVLYRESYRADVPILFTQLREELPIMRAFSVPAFLAGLLVTPATWVANVLVVNQPHGYAEMGVFSAANQWRTVIMFLPSVILQVTLPLYSSLLADETAESQTTYMNMIELTQAVMVNVVFPCALILMIFSTWVMSLYGK